MNQENNIDELDKMLFNYFDSNNDVPNYINETIHNTLQKEKKQRNSFNIMKKVAMIIISFGIISTSFVFADDIINFITSIFTNSTNGIDSAIQNGYIQNVNMDFVYDNDIGVKVDALVLDDTNLDISFIYNYQGDEKIDSLELYEYTIKDENDNILYEFSNDIKDEFTDLLYVSRYNETTFLENGKYKDSIIYTSKEFPNIEKIKLDIKKFKLLDDENTKIISGKWNIEINIDNKFIQKEIEFYEIAYNKYINSGKAELTETSLKIYLEFICDLDNSIVREENNIILFDALKNKYLYDYADMKIENINGKNIKKLYLEYDIGKYFENINELELLIKNSQEDIIIKLSK